MRVGLVIYGSLDTLSGGYLYDRELVGYLRSCGDQVQIVTLPWRNYMTHLAQNFSPALAGQLRGLDVDVLVQDELNHPSLFIHNAALRRRAAYPLVAVVHHLRSSEQHPAGLHWVYRQIERIYLRGVDDFVYNSRTTQAEVERLSGRAGCGVVAYPGGDQFGEGLDDREIMGRSAAPGPLRLLYVGNLIERKGLHTLLAALPALPVDGWTLDVVGQIDVDPRYAARMVDFVQRQGLQARVRFWGRLPAGGLRQLWTESQVLVVPSQYEGFGIVYLEGFSFGLPAVASSAGAAGEIITDGEDGFLIAPGDTKDLTEKIALLIADRDRLARMSLAARRRFAAFPSWHDSSGRIRAHLLEVAHAFQNRTK